MICHAGDNHAQDCRACTSISSCTNITQPAWPAGTQQQGPGQAAPSARAPGIDVGDDADQLDVSVSVKDSGMRLVTALSHDVRWESGAAEARLSLGA